MPLLESGEIDSCEKTTGAKQQHPALRAEAAERISMKTSPLFIGLHPFDFSVTSLFVLSLCSGGRFQNKFVKIYETNCG